MSDQPGDYLVFVDESGDHGLASVDPTYPVFVLVFCLVRKRAYSQQWLPALTEFKFRHFDHDQVILHEREIRKDLGDFSILRDPQRKAAFLAELTELMADLEMTIVASVIRKDELVNRYATPSNPYEIALACGLERLHRYLHRQGHAPGRVPVIVERRGPREDDALELEFRRICNGGNYNREMLHFEPRFVAKSANTLGLQVADLIARPIGRRCLDPKQNNRAWAVIESKLDRSPAGRVEGWGLKIFP